MMGKRESGGKRTRESVCYRTIFFVIPCFFEVHTTVHILQPHNTYFYIYTYLHTYIQCPIITSLPCRCYFVYTVCRRHCGLG
ncbi:hypothetical protein B0T17DRAFT_199602 [Bombardia bombarda]|uniref:Uncharacterized protein n=1 Tax=Bombardia bombarda TaxID=252184 RepID=A0AA39X9K1_9PEZI|nr:hypothetical protein B0T17DRAFT_199602 [Bombardia bombarda]